MTTRALILGRAESVWADYEAALDLGSYHELIVIGGFGADFPHPVDHWVSFHTLLFSMWTEKRTRNGYVPAGQLWGAIYKNKPLLRGVKNPDDFKLVACNGGSSGLVGVTVAIKELGCDRVVLAGIPMTRYGGQYDTNVEWKEADNYWPAWEENMDWLLGSVKSMSGRTKDVLGEPTKEWLNGTSDT